jgi:hypothetical protein
MLFFTYYIKLLITCSLFTTYNTAVPVPLVSAGPCPNCEERGFCGALVVAALSKVHWCSVVTMNGNYKSVFFKFILYFN